MDLVSFVTHPLCGWLQIILEFSTLTTTQSSWSSISTKQSSEDIFLSKSYFSFQKNILIRTNKLENGSVCERKMLPTNNKSPDYVKFTMGRIDYLTHRTTIMKFPNSLLADLIEKSNETRTTSDDHIEIDFE